MHIGWGLLLMACHGPGPRPDQGDSDADADADADADTDTDTDTGADTGSETGVDHTGTVPERAPWIAISGGGYHSHTAMSAWVMGMRDVSGLPLTELMARTEGLSANSGGAWFLTQLAWSESFRDSLETAPDAWMTTGYLGQTAELWAVRGSPCAGLTGTLQLLCAGVDGLQTTFEVATLPGVTVFDQTSFVESVVFAPYGMNDELAIAGLDAPRQAWAEGKPLLFGASLLTDRAVLAQEAFPFAKDLVSAAADPIVPAQLNVTPVTFGSVAGTAPPPGLLPAGDLNLTWTNNEWITPPVVEGTLLAAQPVSARILDVAAASSAGTGPAASIAILEDGGLGVLPVTDDEMAYVAMELAPAFAVTGAGFEHVVPTPGVARVAAAQTVRLADGTYQDNTTVANILGYLAQTGALDDFRIVAFVHTTEVGLDLAGGAWPPDLLRLFGQDTNPPVDGIIERCGGGLCVESRVPQVFDAAGVGASQVVWAWADRGVELAHIVAEVQTVENLTFGVPEGVTGRVDFFVSVDSSSDVLPLSAEVMATYGDVLDVTRDAVANHGGWAELSPLLLLR